MAQYQQMKRQGIRFVVASGNQYYQLISFFPEIAHEIAFVAENGGWVVSEGEDVLTASWQSRLPCGCRTPAHTRRCGDHRLWKNSAYTLKRYDDALKAVAAMYYHRLEFVDNFNNISDVFSNSALILPMNGYRKYRRRCTTPLAISWSPFIPAMAVLI